MPNYSSLSTQVTDIKNEISSSLAASAYSAQDLVYVAKALEALSHVVAPDGISNITINDNIYLGTTAETWSSTAVLTNPTLIVRTSANNYAQIAFQNSNNGSSASTDFIAYSNNGDDNSGWIDMGITSSAYSDPSFTITGAGDGYIFVSGSANGSTDRGNLVLATDSTGTQNKIIFAAGGLGSNNTQMSIIPDDRVHIEIPSPSTSPSTGALTVVGGVGIQGDVNIAGNISFGGSGTTVSTNTLSVADPLIFVGSGNTTDAIDLGMIAEYATAITPNTKTITNKALTSNVATLTTGATHGYLVGDIAVITGVDATFNGTYVITSVPTTTTFTYAKTATNVTSAAVSPVGSVTVSTKRRFAGVVRDASDTVIKFFEDATTKPTSTVNFAEAGLTYADIQVASISASSATIGNVSNTELQYLDGVTSAIQTQIDSKLATSTAASTYAPIASPTFTGTVTLPSATSIGNVSATELGYVDGVTSSIQTQIDTKLSSATASTTYAPLSNAGLLNPTLTGAKETVTVAATAATGTVNVDIKTKSVYYYTANASANWTFNFRGDGSTTMNSFLNVGDSATVAFLVTNGATPYYPNVFQVDGAAVTPKWQGGVAPSSGNASSIDSYTFTIVKTASSTYTVFASQVKFA